MESTDLKSTSSPNVKPKRNYFEQYLPLYQKKGEGESSESWKIKDRTSKNNDYKYSKPERNAGKWQKKQRQSGGFSQNNIDGASLNNSNPDNCLSVHDSKVTSTPLAGVKKSKNKSANTAIQVSQIESNETIEDVSFNLSKSKSNKRNKSVSFQLEENDEMVIKKPKSDISNDTETDDSQCKDKKQKKKKKQLSKENVEAPAYTLCSHATGKDSNIGEPIGLNDQTITARPKESSVQSYVDKETNQRKMPLNGEKTYKNTNKFNKAEDVSLSIPNSDTQQCKGVVSEKIIKKNAKKFKKSASESDITEAPVLKKKPKKQKHQNIPENTDGEPAPKSPKPGIADNLECLSLGDNPHTLVNMINEMTVVDKSKKKSFKKEANREKKSQNMVTIPNENGVKRSKSEEIVSKNEKETDEETKLEGDTVAGESAPKKWEKKHWNKKQKMNNDKMTLNIDNLPISLLKGNFKKMLIDHFSEYGLYRGVGEAYTVNEEVFSTRIYFDTAEAATKALSRDGSKIADNEIRVSEVRPKTETTIVVRIYGPLQKLTAKDLLTTFREFGIIRSVRLVPHRKKTMTTAFVEFDSQEAVDAALDKSVTAKLTVNGATIMVDRFHLRESKPDNEKRKKKKMKKKTKKNKSDSENVPGAPLVEESARDTPADDKLDKDEAESDDYSDSD